MTRKIVVEEEVVSIEFFGRSDLRFNRLIQFLFEEGYIEDKTSPAFAKAIQRTPGTVNRWREYKAFPNSVSLVRMARRFGVNIGWMCGLHGNSIEDAFDVQRENVA